MAAEAAPAWYSEPCMLGIGEGTGQQQRRGREQLNQQASGGAAGSAPLAAPCLTTPLPGPLWLLQMRPAEDLCWAQVSAYCVGMELLSSHQPPNIACA